MSRRGRSLEIRSRFARDLEQRQEKVEVRPPRVPVLDRVAALGPEPEVPEVLEREPEGAARCMWKHRRTELDQSENRGRR